MAVKQWTTQECEARNRIEFTGEGDWRCQHEGWNCAWVAPYGWVAEADCPIHDCSGEHLTSLALLYPDGR